MDFARKIFHYINWLYIQYSLVTALNILDAFERYIFNSVVVCILLIFGYSAYVYLPIQMKLMSNLFNTMQT